MDKELSYFLDKLDKIKNTNRYKLEGIDLNSLQEIYIFLKESGFNLGNNPKEIPSKDNTMLFLYLINRKNENFYTAYHKLVIEIKEEDTMYSGKRYTLIIEYKGVHDIDTIYIDSLTRDNLKIKSKDLLDAVLDIEKESGLIWMKKD